MICCLKCNKSLNVKNKIQRNYCFATIMANNEILLCKYKNRQGSLLSIVA